MKDEMADHLEAVGLFGEAERVRQLKFDTPGGTVLSKRYRAKQKARKVPFTKKQRRAEKRARVAAKSKGFYQSREWKQLRYRALVVHGARCQCCGATPADGARLNVDHIKPRSIYPHLALELSNLQILCASCNMGKGNAHENDWRPPA